MSDYFKHHTALVESEEMGEGTRIWAFAHIMAGGKIGITAFPLRTTQDRQYEKLKQK